MALHGKAAWSIERRLAEKIKVDVLSGCWIWTGAKQISGHGRFVFNGRADGAHRVTYQIHRGMIAVGLELDHLCRTPSCVNPNHLEAVSHRENILRGYTIPARNAAKKYCVRGHALSGENLFINVRGQRVCLNCRRLRDRKYKEKLNDD